MLDLHIHDIDIAYWFLGLPQKVFSFGNKIKDTNNWAHIFTILKYENNIQSIIEGNQNMPKSFPFTMGYRIYFEDTCLVYDFKAPEQKGTNIEPNFTGTMKIYNNKEKLGKVIKLSDSDPYKVEIDYFINEIVENKPFEKVSLDDAIVGMKIFNMIREYMESR